ncbi:ROK family transcriptional regulator [Actinokineospora diospyrosa]|uniref:Sugar kinase of the NBD/HSP70 family, may containing an N-terminal HTH domain n=1 Tax=Actinokineospora diospyrosa TaxID=103728 RepID=A0ABT1ILN5_9PSEU|nr:ROK family transcriptional regulator [Actinokineospora diospyrosa]MCP2273560.1 Sugar kinase of the NBD/HSP70 family, may containing an N-terminal HTH domain [Actinokineospora diospyrosa]
MPDTPRRTSVRAANAAAVLAVIRRDGPLSRAAIGERTGLSMPTVSRQVGVLIELGLLREFPELVPVGAIGRPRVPIHLDDTTYAACGVHIGVSTITYGLADLRGTLLDSEEIPTPPGGPEDVFAHIAGKVRAFLRRWPRRRVVGIGLASGGLVDAERGLLDHDRLGWHRVPAADLLRRATGYPVHLDGHVAAMANAELLFGWGPRVSSLLYFYAREVVGIALSVDGVLHRGPGGGGSIAHLPIGGEVRCPCGATGCLEATVADRTVADKAFAAGVVDEPDIRLVRAAATAGDPTATALLAERAAALGRAVGLLRDALNPDRVVLGGQAITDPAERLPDLLHAFATTTTLPGTDIVSVTRFGPTLQATAACTGLLNRLFDHPLDLLDQAPRPDQVTGAPPAPRTADPVGAP